MNIADLRKSYEKAELSESASRADPLQQFDQWLKEAIASKIPEPNAMTVATVASNLRPSTRVVLNKGYDERGITWFTNFESRKGQELAQALHPAPWPRQPSQQPGHETEHQVRQGHAHGNRCKHHQHRSAWLAERIPQRRAHERRRAGRGHQDRQRP